MNSNLPWTVRLANEAAKQLERLPSNWQQLVRKHLREMREDPLRGDVTALKGKEWKGLYRKVSGQYRIIFSLDHTTRTVEVYAILRRSEKTYR